MRGLRFLLYCAVVAALGVSVDAGFSAPPRQRFPAQPVQDAPRLPADGPAANTPSNSAIEGSADSPTFTTAPGIIEPPPSVTFDGRVEPPPADFDPYAQPPGGPGPSLAALAHAASSAVSGGHASPETLSL